MNNHTICHCEECNRLERQKEAVGNIVVLFFGIAIAWIIIANVYTWITDSDIEVTGGVISKEYVEGIYKGDYVVFRNRGREVGDQGVYTIKESDILWRE